MASENSEKVHLKKGATYIAAHNAINNSGPNLLVIVQNWTPFMLDSPLAAIKHGKFLVPVNYVGPFSKEAMVAHLETETNPAHSMATWRIKGTHRMMVVVWHTNSISGLIGIGITKKGVIQGSSSWAHKIFRREYIPELEKILTATSNETDVISVDVDGFKIVGRISKSTDQFSKLIFSLYNQLVPL